jgi:hypothetical protein
MPPPASLRPSLGAAAVAAVLAMVAACGDATNTSSSRPLVIAGSSTTPALTSTESTGVPPPGDHSTPAAAVTGLVQALTAFDGSDSAPLLVWIAPSQRAAYAASLQALAGRKISLHIDGFRVTDVAFGGNSPGTAEVTVTGSAVLCTATTCQPTAIGPDSGGGRLLCRREGGFWYVALPTASTSQPAPSPAG